MAKKSLRKAKKASTKVKTYRGLKKYVVIGLISVVAIAAIVFVAVWNNVAERNYAVAFVNLPNTGDVTYYTNCYMDNANGVLTYADKSTQKCVYLGPQSDGYDYETSTALLKCTPNDPLLLNVCTAGKLR